MTMTLRKGCLVARQATTDRDIARAQALRGLCFGVTGSDRDQYDRSCDHVLIEDARSQQLIATFRMAVMDQQSVATRSYSSQFYDLHGFAGNCGQVLEIGRFCVAPDHPSADVLRVAWGALTHVVDDQNIKFMIGCSSFPSTDPTQYSDALTLLAHRHQAPIAIGKRAFENVDIKSTFVNQPLDAKRAMSQVPPLLKTYLGMQGWVSDHGVIDRQLKTFHVFTAVEIAKIPAARAKALRAVAYGSG